MSDLHDAFDSWLTRGARDDLPRAVALHASACPGCLRAGGAFDALAAIDLEAAELPPLRVAAAPVDRRFGLVPATAAAIAVLLVIGAGIVAGGSAADQPSDRSGIAGDQGCRAQCRHDAKRSCITRESLSDERDILLVRTKK